jgi:hypothetical protein
MNTSNQLQSTKRVRYRETTYTWRNEVLDKNYHEANDAGEQVTLTITHDPKRKQYEAIVRVSWWQPTTSTGFLVTLWAPFDNVTYPSGCVNITPVARYGDKSFAQFENETWDILHALIAHEDDNSVVANIISRIKSYTINQ